MKLHTRQIIMLFGLLFFSSSISASPDEKLVVSEVCINSNSKDTREFADIQKIEYYFNTDTVCANDGVVGSIYCDGKLIFQEELKFTLSKCNENKGTRAWCYLNPPVELLPTDKVYRIVLPAGAIYKKGDPSVVTEEIVKDCYIPSKLSINDCSITDRHPVKTESCLMFYYDVELQSPLKPHSLILYREGIPIMDFSTSGGWDFGFGFATSMFDGFLNFEKGVNYTFVLPEGSVYAKVRSDIVNAESVCSFVGASDRSFAPIEYSSCSVEGSKGLTELGVVTVDYSTSVQLAPGARLQLLDSDGSVKKEADATLSDNGKTWTVSADFGGCVVNGGFSLCIPESTVVGTGSDITVNRRTLVPLDGSVSVESVAVSEPTVSVRGMSLMVGGVERGDRVVVCDVSGMTVCDAVADSGSMTVSLRSKGLYIVKVNGMAFKVRVS